MKEFDLDLEHSISNYNKIEKTVKRCIKKAKYFLGTPVPGTLTNFTISKNGNYVKFISHQDMLKRLIRVANTIRYYDNYIEEKGYEKSQIEDISEKLRRDSKGLNQVGRLFERESQLARRDFDNEKKVIEDLKSLKASDLLLLVDMVKSNYEYRKEYGGNVTYEYLSVYQELRCFINELLSITRDVVKGELNYLLEAKRLDIDIRYLKDLVYKDIYKMREISNKDSLPSGVDKVLRSNTSYWSRRTEEEFIPLIGDLWTDTEKYKENLFIIKQI